MDVRINRAFSSRDLAVRGQAWEEKDRQARAAISARVCPECGAPLAAACGCLECPRCGWAACA